MINSHFVTGSISIKRVIDYRSYLYTFHFYDFYVIYQVLSLSISSVRLILSVRLKSVLFSIETPRM